MEDSILELIYYNLPNPNLAFSGYDETETEKEFVKKYIAPVAEKDSKLGMEMEELFSNVMNEARALLFKKGVRFGVRFMMECMETGNAKEEE